MVSFLFFFFGLKRQFRDIVQQQPPSLNFYLHYTFLYRIKQNIFLPFFYAPTHILFKTKFIQIYVLPSLNLFLHNLEPVKAKHFLFGLIFISHENHPLISCPRQKLLRYDTPTPTPVSIFLRLSRDGPYYVIGYGGQGSAQGSAQ
jgi:hypothetical protein